MARKLLIDLSVIAAIGIVLGILGPFNSDDMPIASRISYWVLLSVAGYFCYHPIGSLIVRHAPSLELPVWFLWGAGVVLATVPMSIVVWLVNQAPGPFHLPGFEAALTHYFYVLLVGAVITLMFNLIDAARRQSPPAPPPELTVGAKPRARFLDRLPPALGDDLIALEMEDHYLRAHTALGSELMLMRMRDAVAELDGADGLQVHRSWWVARGAVEDVQRDGRNLRLRLTSGLQVPVSRANVSLLKEAGWL